VQDGWVKVVISGSSKFHSFDLAREMHRRNAFAGIFSGYPLFKLRGEGLPMDSIHSFPYVHMTYKALMRIGVLGSRQLNWWEHANLVTFDAHVASRLPPCDVFVGQSGSTLLSGRAAQRRGIRFVCDRGPAHIRVQDRLLREEYERWGVPFAGIDPRVISREEEEYAQADRITVASTFSVRSFVEQGISPDKVRKVPYGVNLSQFYPTDAPDPSRFDVLFVGFVGLQKGVPYLLQAFERVQHPKKSLTLAGSVAPEFTKLLRRHNLPLSEVRSVGHVVQSELKYMISRSHVLVLPSIQDGFGLVLPEAMACGCVVIGTHHTGAPDLVTEGQDGFVVPVRDSEALASRLQYLADDPDRRAEMGRRAVDRVRLDRGWCGYGDRAMSVYGEVAS
jgi:glycosyltransferase involved in cell wall biosynthesis